MAANIENITWEDYITNLNNIIQSTYPNYKYEKLNPNDSKERSEIKYNKIRSDIELKVFDGVLSKNEMYDNWFNLVKEQKYFYTAKHKKSLDYNFYNSIGQSGTMIATENLLTGTKRSFGKDVAGDMAKMNGEPDSEQIVAFYSEHTAVDIAVNEFMGSMVSLGENFNLLNTRGGLADRSTDRDVADAFLSDLQSYADYSEVVITVANGATPIQIAEAHQAGIGLTIFDLTTNNNQLSKGKFWQNYDASDLGLIFNPAAQVNRVINYLRKFLTISDGRVGTDWGVGDIIVKNIDTTNDNTCLLIARYKWNIGQQSRVYRTQAGFTGVENYLTFFKWWNSMFMENGAAFKISVVEAEPPAEIRKNLIAKKQKLQEQYIKLLTNRLAILTNIKEFKYTDMDKKSQKIAIMDCKRLLKYFSEKDYTKEKDLDIKILDFTKSTEKNSNNNDILSELVKQFAEINKGNKEFIKSEIAKQFNKNNSQEESDNKIATFYEKQTTIDLKHNETVEKILNNSEKEPLLSNESEINKELPKTKKTALKKQIEKLQNDKNTNKKDTKEK